MKRYNNLYEKIISLENLRLADERARKGKKKSYGVRVHDKNRERNIIRLHDMLVERRYKTSAYTIFKIYEPKERDIYRLPYFPDRILHHAIMNILEPIWLGIFTHNTFSCMKNRGVHACMRATKKAIKSFDGRPLYCLKIDIRKFYPSVDHDVMKAIIRRKIKDRDLLTLLDEIIDSAPGLPIGNYISQYMANLYFAYYMHALNERYSDIKVMEYADDFCHLSDSKQRLHEAFHDFIKPTIENDLQLTVKSNYQIFPIAEDSRDSSGRALDFVGFKFYRRHTLMRKSIKQNFCREMKRLRKKQMPAEVYKQKASPWLGWAKYSNSKNLVNKLIGDKL